jgi:hypothetical protein
MPALDRQLPYLATESVATGAAVVSVVATVESTATAVESVAVASLLPEPHAVKPAAITNANTTFFIFVLFYCLKFDITNIRINIGISKHLLNYF